MRTEHINVNGMTCGSCTSTVTRALQAIPGVSEVNVSLTPGQATVKYDENVTSPRQLKSAVTAAGYGVGMPDATAAQPVKGKGGCCS